MLDLFHLSTWKHAWLGEGKTALWCIGAALVWQAVGYYMVMHVASIDGISQEVYEAASIDGATGVQKFFEITIHYFGNLLEQLISFLCPEPSI